MISKHIKYFCVILIYITILVGCSSNNNDMGSSTVYVEENQTQVEKDFGYLTSDECAGRRPGTLGNEKAAEYIVKRYGDIGLVSLEQDYTLSYTKRTETLDSNKIKLELLDGSNIIDSLTYGEDFIEIFLDDVDLTLPLVDQPSNTDYAVLAEDIAAAEEYRKDSHVKLIFRKSEKLTRSGSFYMKDSILELSVLPETYDKLKENFGKFIRFTVDVNIEDIVQNNIVGVIKGKNNNNALIVSAHFDHIGSAGKNIWRGAFDNASGVCALLKTAQVVTDLYEDTLPPYDILFCAFNSEEGKSLDESGSSHFIEQIKDIYQSVFDINLDCLGNKNYASLLIYNNDSNSSKNIKDDIIKSLKKSKIGSVMESTGYYASDHCNFKNAICLTTIANIASSNIHTLDDTPDKIDTEYLSSVGKSLGAYIVNDMNMENLFNTLNIEAVTDNNEDVKHFVRKTLSAAEFEEVYNCRLDFADDYLREIHIDGSRPLVSDQQNEDTTDANNLKLWDIRQVSFIVDKDKFIIDDDVRINFISYDKNNAYEMSIKDEELESNGYLKDFMLSPITINDTEYYLADYRKGYRPLSTFYENDKLIIWVSVTFVQPLDEEDYSQEDYKNLYLEYVPTQYISGMVDLLLQNTQ